MKNIIELENINLKEYDDNIENESMYSRKHENKFIITTDQDLFNYFHKYGNHDLNEMKSFVENSKITEENLKKYFHEFSNNFLRYVNEVYIYNLKFHNEKFYELLKICLIVILKNNNYSLNVFYADKFNKNLNEFFVLIEKINILDVTNDFLKHIDIKYFQIVNNIKELKIRNMKNLDFNLLYKILKWNKLSIKSFYYEGEKSTFNFNGLNLERMTLKFNTNDVNIFCYPNFGNYLKSFNIGFFEWETPNSLLILNIEINFSMINKWEEYKKSEINQNYTFDNLANLKDLKVILIEKEKPINSYLNVIPNNFLTIFKNKNIEILEINFDLEYQILCSLKNLKFLIVSENIFECYGCSPGNLLKYLKNNRDISLCKLTLNKFNNLKFYSRLLFDEISELENLNYLKITNFNNKNLEFYTEMFSAISKSDSLRTLVFDIDMEISEEDWKKLSNDYILKSDLTKLVIINSHTNKNYILNCLKDSLYLEILFEDSL